MTLMHLSHRTLYLDAFLLFVVLVCTLSSGVAFLYYVNAVFWILLKLIVYAGLPVLLKFHRCHEIVLKSAIVLKFYSFGQNVLMWTIVMLSLHFFTSHDYVYVADVECQVMFSLVTLFCFMCNIPLVTFLGLLYWSASMINIYEHRKTCIFCVFSLVKPTSVLKFSKNLILKFHFLLLGALYMFVLYDGDYRTC